MGRGSSRPIGSPGSRAVGRPIGRPIDGNQEINPEASATPALTPGPSPKNGWERGDAFAGAWGSANGMGPLPDLFLKLHN
jgi:hypothetical protein